MSNLRIAYVLPTRDRPERLLHTLSRLDALPAHDAQVIIVDNASRVPASEATRGVAGVLPRVFVRLEHNLGAAARNLAVELTGPSVDWIVMLDDDSSVRSLEFLARLGAQPADVGAVMADIFLPRAGTRESGGLPEVFIGCGVAIRREAFLEAGGYDPAFNYYAEEYDLSAKLLLAGRRVVFEPAFVADHLKDAGNRDMDTILARLVRNNGWVMQRYAPEGERRAELREVRTRYRAIARKEHALRGFGEGLVELRRTIGEQARRAMPREMFDRFIGLAAAREALQAAHRRSRFSSAALVSPGKNAGVVRRALEELGVLIVGEERGERLVIATMSPGPMLDAAAARAGDARVIVPWLAGGAALRAARGPMAA
ncbi:MAG: glycosyltransferase [Phycisphaerae bacterium]|nr:glycosyltransferase [Phycisphaerae bacterium]